MDEIRSNIQIDVCKLLAKLNDLPLYDILENDIAEIRAILYHILDQLDRPETMEHVANR